MKENPHILIIDDVAENRRLLAKTIQENTEFGVSLASEGPAALQAITRNPPDLILLDIMMPLMDGFEVARELKANSRTRNIPILFITAVTDLSGISKAFKSGGVDYITKPFNRIELLARVNAHMALKLSRDEIVVKNQLLADEELHLKNLVERKTEKIANTTLALVNALDNANYYNDTDTGFHIKRVSEYSALLASVFVGSVDFTKRIGLYASLHDVGKVGISDALLKKPGRYTTAEFQKMQEHVTIGARMLDDPEIDEMAKNIALYHHEKWDGSGYGAGLKGKAIPVEGRIVALADVYDALGCERVYKPAYPEDRIDQTIGECSGTHFQPELVEVYFSQKDRFLEIKDRLSQQG